MDAQVQLAGQITSKPTNNGGTKFDIPLSNGLKPSTFDDSLISRIVSFGGQPFTARLEQKPNPRGGAPYTNLIAVAGPGETLPPPQPQAGAPVGQSFIQATPPVIPGVVPAPQGGKGGFSEEDKIRITKLAVLGSATQLVAALFHGAGPEALEDAVPAIESLAKHFYTAARSHEAGQQQPQVPPQQVAAEPQAVAQYVAEQAGTPVVQVGVEGVQQGAVAASLPWS